MVEPAFPVRPSPVLDRAFRRRPAGVETKTAHCAPLAVAKPSPHRFALWQAIVSQCGMPHLKYDQPPIDPAACRASLGRVDEEKGGYFGMRSSPHRRAHAVIVERSPRRGALCVIVGYALYDDCIYQEGLRRRRRRLNSITEVRPDAVTVDAAARVGPLRGHGWGGAVNDYVCGGGDAYKEWVDHPTVRKALHVYAAPSPKRPRAPRCHMPDVCMRRAAVPSTRTFMIPMEVGHTMALRRTSCPSTSTWQRRPSCAC